MRLDVNGHEVFAATGGKEFDTGLPTVVFLHGSGLDHRSFALQTRWFAYHGYSVLAPDLPGHSLSAGNACASIEDSASWFSDFLDAAGVKSAHLVGHSQGFLTAIEFAKKNPERALSLTAIGTAAAIPVNQALIDTAKASSAKAAHMMVNWGFGPGAHNGISAVPGMQPIAIGRAIMSRNPLAADLQACADYTSGDAAVSSLGNIPGCCILADKDKMTPLKAGLKLADSMGVKPIILKGYGHMLPIEAPRQTLDALRNFVSAVQSQAAA
ncbi:MAG: alpha/beta hydrolase [Hellea sp.]|nr:alpha/beta hydrolase [Hellea sp.]